MYMYIQQHNNLLDIKRRIILMLKTIVFQNVNMGCIFRTKRVYSVVTAKAGSVVISRQDDATMDAKITGLGISVTVCKMLSRTYIEVLLIIFLLFFFIFRGMGSFLIYFFLRGKKDHLKILKVVHFKHEETML